MSDVKLDSLVETYLAIRNERDKLSREHDAKDKELSNDLAQIEQVLLNSCNEVGADSIRTGAGTVIKSTKENFVCGDWDNFKKYVMDNDAIELLQQRIHQTNFKEFLSNREDEGLPPGISSMREFKVTVRKPTSK
ncbi:MAG: hypothetical protein CMI60_22160 [Parvibaculum sp.]|nr:hypothetical protein [Parvibaculum sp.]|tara:strand:+ start:2945 stop:3349 length:405 start_codon:yes stop_codon:yes gene_type:complete